MTSSVPKAWQGILWSRDVRQLKWNEDKVYIIHQVLMYGSLDDIKRLFAHYGKSAVSRVFTSHPQKIYTPAAFNFIKTYLLGIHAALPQDRYVRRVY